MQLWEGPGQHDNLRSSQLRNHLRKGKQEPSSLAADGKSSVPRWRTWRIIDVAQLVNEHGVAMRRALKLDVSPDAVLPAHERIAQAEARAVELETELVQVRVARDKAQNAFRKAAERNRSVVEVRAKAVKAVRAAAKQARQVAVKAARAKAASQLVATAEKANRLRRPGSSSCWRSGPSG